MSNPIYPMLLPHLAKKYNVSEDEAKLFWIASEALGNIWGFKNNPQILNQVFERMLFNKGVLNTLCNPNFKLDLES